MLIKLASAGKEGLFCGDIMHHPMQIYEVGWSSAFCSDAAEARVSRRRMLEHAASRNAIVYPAHFGGPHICRIGEEKGGFTFLPGSEESSSRLFASDPGQAREPGPFPSTFIR